jgi:hypothetical protein
VKDGFKELITRIELKGEADIPLSLTIAAQQAQVNVTEKATTFANSDAAYRQLRNLGLGGSYRCDKAILNMDVGTFEFRSGTITLLAVFNRFETGAIFIGQGHFTLKPLGAIETREMIRRTGRPTAEEEFTEVVFRFSGNEYPEFATALGAKTETPPEAAIALQHWRDRVRHRREVPEGFTQVILEGATIDNVDADVLAAVYNPKHPPFFNAYMRGVPHKDLRFFIRSRVGALPQLDSPEEVALVNCDGGAMDDGIWYSEHLLSERKAHTANSREDKRLFAARRYSIETVIAKNDHLQSRTTITFESLVPGERVLKFGLLPNLRVTRVTDENGQNLHFIQEGRKEDGSFYAILDEAPAVGKEHSISIEYFGDKVLTDAGDGSYYVSARESWYPNLNGFGEKSLYDLTFKVPPPNVVISIGKLEGQTSEAGYAVFHWVTPAPVAIAGFNYGRYKKMDYPDDITHYEISGYYLTELPSSLKPYQNSAFLGSMAPAAMTKFALDQARAQMQVCTRFFGRAPYNNVYITEQPNFSFGQSWPNLVYLPISAYMSGEPGATNRDQGFIDMMHDFIESHRDSPASTESFKAIAEKHITKQMDVQKNGRLDWFFNEWVYGTEIPRYSFKYTLQPGEGGKTKVHVELTQSEVDENFAMFVPIFADYGNGMVRLGQLGIVGNATRVVDFTLDHRPKKIALNAYKDVLER